VAAGAREGEAGSVDVRRQRQRTVLCAASQIQTQPSQLSDRGHSRLQRCTNQPINQSTNQSINNISSPTNQRHQNVPDCRQRAERAPRSALSVLRSSPLSCAVHSPIRCTWQSHSPYRFTPTSTATSHCSTIRPSQLLRYCMWLPHTGITTRTCLCTAYPCSGACASTVRHRTRQRIVDATSTYRWRFGSRAGIQDGAGSAAAADRKHQRRVLDRRR
jgi:hypothetical protein